MSKASILRSPTARPTMDNFTILKDPVNHTDQSLSDLTIHISSHVLIASLLCGPPLILHLIFITALLAKRSINKLVKITLTNISLSGAVYSTAMLVWVISYISRVLQPGMQTVECYLHLWIQITSSTATFISLLEFGVVLFIVVKRGIKKLRVPYLILVAVVPWVVGVCNSIPPFTPIQELNATDVLGTCFYTFNPIAAFINLAISWIILGLGACIVTMILAIASYCFVRRNALTEDRQLHSGLYKLAGFLILSDIVLIAINLVVPTVYTILSPEGWVQYYLSISLFPAATWPSPISLLTVYGPVRRTLRKAVKKLNLCGEERKSKVEPSVNNAV